jgi:hypothetical protein
MPNPTVTIFQSEYDALIARVTLLNQIIHDARTTSIATVAPHLFNRVVDADNALPIDHTPPAPPAVP